MRNIDLENEREIENRKAIGEPVRAKQSKYYWATSIPTQRHKEETLKAIKGAEVLEIGCASGDDAIDYCKHAKSYLGVDISDVAIVNYKAFVSEWFDSQQRPNSNVSTLSQARIQQSNPRLELAAEEAECLNKLEAMAMTAYGFRQCWNMSSIRTGPPPGSIAF